MARVKSILKRLELATVKTKRTCKNSRRKMLSGEKCLIVYDGIFEHAPYSREVALQMIAEAHQRLDELEEAFRQAACSGRTYSR